MNCTTKVKKCLGPALPVNLTLRKLLTELRSGFGPGVLDGEKLARENMNEGDCVLPSPTAHKHPHQ